MSFRKILMPVQAEMDVSQISQFAFSLARQFNSHVEGIFLHPESIQEFWLDNFGRSEVEIETIEKKQEIENRKCEDRVREIFLACAKAHKNSKARFLSMYNQPISSFTDHSFYADLLVMENSTTEKSKHWQQLLMQMLSQSVRPVFLTPTRPVSKKLGSRIVIAWKHTAETSRAIAAALPLIENAEKVEIVSIGEPQNKELLASVIDYISLYAKNVESISLKAGNEKIGRLLIDKTAEEDGSVLVMGAYSHSRLSERVFGGVTHFVIHNADVPVLMMH